MRIQFFATLLFSACIPTKGPASGGQPSEPAGASEAAAIAESWRIDFTHATASHAVSGTESLTHSGQTVSIAAGYTTPWHGTCAEASRTEKAQPIADAIAERGAQLEGSTRLRFGAGEARVITLTCADAATPPLQLVIGNLGNFALTCHADVCHTLATK